MTAQANESAAGSEQSAQFCELADALYGVVQALHTQGRRCLDRDEDLRAISYPRARVLRAMCAEPTLHMGELSEALGVTARNITTIIDGLEREGFVTRRPDPTDRRAILLELTPRSRAHFPRAEAAHAAIAEQFFAPLDAAERGELLRLLRKALAGQASLPSARSKPGERK